jgi:hypothetical protein
LYTTDFAAGVRQSISGRFRQNQADDTESIESLIERLDATVLGLIEELDAESADLPRLALKGAEGKRLTYRQPREPANT